MKNDESGLERIILGKAFNFKTICELIWKWSNNNKSHANSNKMN